MCCSGLTAEDILDRGGHTDFGEFEIAWRSIQTVNVVENNPMT